MRLALKLFLVFMLANVACAGVFGYLHVRREVERFKRNAKIEVEEVGPVVEEILANLGPTKGDQDVEEVLDKVVRRQQPALSIRWVSFNVEAETRFRPVVPRERLTLIVIQQHDAIETGESDGERSLHVYWPVTLLARRNRGLEFNLPETDLAADVHEVIRRTVLLIGGMLAISGLLAVLLGIRLVGRPLEQLIAKARRIGDGDLEGPINLRSGDELAELAVNLNARVREVDRIPGPAAAGDRRADRGLGAASPRQPPENRRPPGLGHRP